MLCPQQVPLIGNVPWGPFLNHAEGHTLIQAAADGLSQTKGKKGFLYVTEMPCRMCRNNFKGMKELLQLGELQDWYLDDLGIAKLWKKY